jgi:DNA-binding CsgD family transcriptional regulator
MAEHAAGVPVGVASGHELAALLDVTRALTGPLDHRGVAAAVLEGAEKLFGECAGFLWHLERGSEAFHVVAVRGFRGGGRVLPPFRVDQGLTGLAAAHRRPAISVDIRDDSRVLHRDWLVAEGLVSAIALPLVHAGTLYGTLNLFTRARHDFTAEEVHLLESFAAQAALALENARLLERLAEQATLAIPHGGSPAPEAAIGLAAARRPAAAGGLPRPSGSDEPPLSRRERQVLELVALGHTNQEIAGHLAVSVKTIEGYRARVAVKLGLRRRTDFVRFALESGLLR